MNSFKWYTRSITKKDPVPLLHLLNQSHSHSILLSTQDSFTRTFKFFIFKITCPSLFTTREQCTYMQRCFLCLHCCLIHISWFSVHEWLSSSTVIHTHTQYYMHAQYENKCFLCMWYSSHAYFLWLIFFFGQTSVSS